MQHRAIGAVLGTKPPDAVVLDLVLPDGKGTDVCRELRKWSAAPVIVLSAAGIDDLVWYGLALAQIKTGLKVTRSAPR